MKSATEATEEITRSGKIEEQDIEKKMKENSTISKSIMGEIMNKYIINEKIYDTKKNSLILRYSQDEKVYIHNDKKIDIKAIHIYIKENISKFREIVFFMDFSKQELSLQQSDNLVVSIKKIQNIKIIKEVPIYVYYIAGKSYYEQFVITSLCVLNCKSKTEKYSYLYDSVCEYLDNRVVSTNVCGFENDKCIAKRDTNCTMGCCHHYKNKYFGVLYEKKLHLCEYQKNKKCTAKCITCKMYMCDTLRKKGYNFNTKNVITLKRYFNVLQKLVIISSFFTPKDKILKKILLLSFEK